MNERDNRRRLGVVLPSVNTVAEPWFSRVVPQYIGGYGRLLREH